MNDSLLDILIPSVLKVCKRVEHKQLTKVGGVAGALVDPAYPRPAELPSGRYVLPVVAQDSTSLVTLFIFVHLI